MAHLSRKHALTAKPASLERTLPKELPTDSQQARLFLKPLVGRWFVEGVVWPDKSRHAQTFRGHSTIRFVGGEPFLQEQFSGFSDDVPLSFVAYTGFDAVREQFSVVWLTAQQASLMTGLGTVSPQEQRYDFDGYGNDPASGALVPMHVSVYLAPTSLSLYLYRVHADRPVECLLEAMYSREPD